MLLIATALAVVLAVMLSLWILYRYKQLGLEGFKYRLPLPVKYFVRPNTHQCVTVYSTEAKNGIEAKTITTTLSLAKLTDPYSIYFDTQPAMLHINVQLSYPSHCFYIHSKRYIFSHLGKDLSKVYLLNKTSYKMSGTISDKVDAFAQKHLFCHLYSSYIPENTECPFIKENNFIELKIKLEEVTPEILADFVELLKSLPKITAKQQEKKLAEFSGLKNKLYRKENASFWAKMSDQIKVEAQKKLK
ncbi:hypothetical protein ENBRE01_0172 [Enteropsectra breve]|nr:hypothetical protein ENBRE01_0172 [Enteropsectra breve]